MAGLSGPQLQDQLAELGCSLPIIFISGHGDIPTTVQTIKAGAKTFLTKPVPKEKLLPAIERALVRHEEMREHDNRITDLRSALPGLRLANTRCSRCWFAASPTSRLPMRWVFRNGPSKHIDTM